MPTKNASTNTTIIENNSDFISIPFFIKKLNYTPLVYECKLLFSVVKESLTAQLSTTATPSTPHHTQGPHTKKPRPAVQQVDIPVVQVAMHF